MKTICIYHSRDLDGWMSAAIVKYWYTEHVKTGKFTSLDNIDFLDWDYGDEIPNLSEYDKVIMVDISFPKEEMLNLWQNKGLNFHWVDHHVSAIKKMEDAHENISSEMYPIQGFRNTQLAACELTWFYFMPDEPLPEIVRLLGAYDIFRHKNTNEEQKVLEFQYGARAYIENYNKAYYFLKQEIENDKSNMMEEILKSGEGIYKYLCTEAQKIYKKGFTIYLQEKTHDDGKIVGVKFRKFICFNKERFNLSNFNIDYYEDGYVGIASFFHDGKRWEVTLYSDKDNVDCSTIAESFGGGGHKHAAGFKIENIDKFLSEIKK